MAFLVCEDDLEVSLHRHPIGFLSAEVAQIFQPLSNAFGLNYFAYARLFDRGQVSFLTTMPELSESFIRHQGYKIGFASDFREYHDGVYCFDYLPKNILSDISLARDVSHYFCCIKKQADHTDIFYFAAPLARVNINQVYLNQRDAFESFMAYFKERAEKLIKKTDEDKVYLPSSLCQESVLVGNFKDFSKDCSALFFGGLTDREKVCLISLGEGLCFKELAFRMNISVRTFEKHVASIKKRMGCSSVAELLLRIYGGLM